MAKALSIIALITLAIHCDAAPASAQSDLSIGYQFVRLSPPDGAFNLPVGVGIEYAHSIANGWKVVGIFGWSRNNERRTVDSFSIDTTFAQSTFGGGIRREVNVKKGHAYIQAALGAARSSFRATSNSLPAIDSTSSDLMFQPGVGFTSDIASHLGPFGEIAYRAVWPRENSQLFLHETVSGFRVFVGARIRMP
jgi:hypothetical protein